MKTIKQFINEDFKISHKSGNDLYTLQISAISEMLDKSSKTAKKIHDFIISHYDIKTGKSDFDKYFGKNIKCCYEGFFDILIMGVGFLNNAWKRDFDGCVQKLSDNYRIEGFYFYDYSWFEDDECNGEQTIQYLLSLLNRDDFVKQFKNLLSEIENNRINIGTSDVFELYGFYTEDANNAKQLYKYLED